jgi:hypothetical protein
MQLNRDHAADVREPSPVSALKRSIPITRQIMRSQLVYEAGLKIENRFLLATTAMQATRKLHVSSTRTEDTVNRVLAELANGEYAHGELPEVTPPPVVDALLITPAA